MTRLFSFPLVAFSIYASMLAPTEITEVEQGTPCSNSTLRQTISFLQKEKVRILTSELGEIAAVGKISKEINGESSGFLVKHESDLRDRLSRTQSNQLLLSRPANGNSGSAEAAPLSPDILTLQSYVRSRVKSFPYRNEDGMQDAMLDLESALGHLQLLKDQFTEVEDWQRVFVEECKSVEYLARKISYEVAFRN